jgi:hypothetical protein
MMPDEHDAENAKGELELTELVGRIGNCYVRRGLSPPSQLYGAVRHWLGLTHGEIGNAIERHLDEHRWLYTCGSGDGHFWMVEDAIRKAWQAKHPSIERADDEPEPRRRPSGHVQKVHNTSGGRPDVYVEGRAARQVRRGERPTADLSGYTGHERVVIANLEDEADA